MRSCLQLRSEATKSIRNGSDSDLAQVPVMSAPSNEQTFAAVAGRANSIVGAGRSAERLVLKSNGL